MKGAADKRSSILKRFLNKPPNKKWRIFCYINMNGDEQWKDIEEYEGTFQISSFGNIKRTKSPSGKLVNKLLKFRKNKNGYITISLWKNGKKKTYKIHRLVADAFIEGKNKEKNVVHHKNYNRSDNKIDNLEWVTPIYNTQNKIPKELKKKRLLNKLLKILDDMNLLKKNKDFNELEILKRF